MFDAYFDIFTVPEARELVAKPIITRLDETSTYSPNWVVTLMLPYADWEPTFNRNAITGWARAALAVPYTEEVGQNVVKALLQIASNDFLQPSIPVDIWALLKRRPSLPHKCNGLLGGTQGRVVHSVREIGDIELLESYFLLVWAECHYVYTTGLREMRTSIREDFGGIGMGGHREVLIKHLDHVLGQLDMGLDHLKQRYPSLNERRYRRAKSEYGAIKELLLEVDGKASEILARTPLRLTDSFDLLTPTDVHRIPLDVLLRAPSPVSVVARPQHLPPVLPPPYFFHTRVPHRHPFELHRSSPNSSKHASPATPRRKNYAALTPSVEIGSAGWRAACVVAFVSKLSCIA